jgi:hypothetical protein
MFLRCTGQDSTAALSRPRRYNSLMQARSVVDLPAGVAGEFEVYLNGVLQQPGTDYRLEGRALVFDRALEREGRLGFWRWLSMVLGIAGSYGRNDTVDVIYDAGGRRVVATGLPFRSA